VHERKVKAAEQRKRQIATLEDEIEAVEAEFAGKMDNASRVAMKLRATLEMLQKRKVERIVEEKQRSADRNRGLRENSKLRRRIFVLEQHVTRSREILYGLRRDVSATVGPRITASLFLS
jgi:phage-related minor tail protein